MKREQIRDILKKHSAWLHGEAEGERADLSWADLIGADLSEANLNEANLYRANLIGADLCGASLRGAIGNGREVKTLIASQYIVTWTDQVMAIGCEQHRIADWWEFDDECIATMAYDALEWWARWRPVLRQLVGSSEPAGETNERRRGNNAS